MTESEWLTCTDPQPMLEFWAEQVSERTLRLFACACCRRVQHLFRQGWERRALEMAERMAEGQEREDWFAEVEQTEVGPGMRPAANAVASAVIWWNPSLAVQDVAERAAYAVGLADDPSGFQTVAGTRREKEAQASLLRDVVHDPFRPVPIDLKLFTPTVTAIATGIYKEKAFDRMPVLGDVLEDAGCDNKEILSHCRHPGEHARGCWVVDLVLGKE